MTVSGENTLRIAGWGAAVFWIGGATSIIRDLYFPEPYSKGGWMTEFVMLTAFCGTAFYLMIAPQVLRFWRTQRSAGLGLRWPRFAWALSPVPLILVAVATILYLIATRD